MEDEEKRGEAKDPNSPEPTPPPIPKKPRLRDAARAAMKNPPSRVQDQILYWTIRTGLEATKTLGFPIVMAFLLAGFLAWMGFTLRDSQKDTLKMQQALMLETNKAQVAAQDRISTALKEMAEEQADSNELTRSLMVDLGLRPPAKRKAKKEADR